MRSPHEPKSCRGNTAHTRQRWCDYFIHTDYTIVVPNTGVTREYWLSIDEVTVSPYSVPRSAMAMDGTIPGPTVYTDWGDKVVVHVTNHLDTSKWNEYPMACYASELYEP